MFGVLDRNIFRAGVSAGWILSLAVLLVFGPHSRGFSQATDAAEERSHSVERTSPVEWVNPLIGTAPLTDPEFLGYELPDGWRVWAGLVYPGVSLPNAMVQLSPVTEYGSGAGYEYEDEVIRGFAHTNKGHWNYLNVPVLPFTGELPARANGSSFSHEHETAEAGFYRVRLEDYGVEVALTSTPRAGYHRYRYAGPKDRKILFDLGRSNDEVTGWQIERNGPRTLRGTQRCGDYAVRFYARLNTDVRRITRERAGEEEGRAVVHLEAGSNGPVEMRIGLSFVSTANARANLRAEIGDRSFEDVRVAAVETWAETLSRIEVEGGTARQKELFYTSLYRSLLWPALRSDVNGQYRDVDGEVVQADFDYYTKPALWDTYRNKLVLLGNLAPEVTGDVIRSLQDRGEKTGFIPTFFHGDHAAAFIAGAHARGIDGYDLESVYELLLRNATVEGGTRPHLGEYMDKGYVSTPRIETPGVETDGKAGVAKTLEYAYDDYAVAQLAKALGRPKEYEMLMERSRNYRNVFDPAVNFMRGRLSDGDWVEPFNPQHPYYTYMYREANAWQVSFYAPHDMKGLVELYGGGPAFEAKLDSFFAVPWNENYVARNVCCFIGQYAQGNQPDHAAPFAYYFVGKPEKSQRIVDRILNEFYGSGMEGLALPGMDDAGEMSAWYVFSALGLYPYSPADPEYLVTVPLFERVRWKLGDGEELIVEHTTEGRNLRHVELDGRRIEGYLVPHEVFEHGGRIEVVTESDAESHE